ncbi:MAG: hypothetical protein V2A79_11095 [Planctomycetota bacterium]
MSDSDPSGITPSPERTAGFIPALGVGQGEAQPPLPERAAGFIPALGEGRGEGNSEKDLSDLPPMTAEDYAKLPPLVRRGEDRQAVLERVVRGWCAPTGAEKPAEHVAKGGFLLDRVTPVDENSGEPIDLGELVRQVEERLRVEGEPEDFRERPDLHIILRGRRSDRGPPGVRVVPVDRMESARAVHAGGSDGARALGGPERRTTLVLRRTLTCGFGVDHPCVPLPSRQCRSQEAPWKTLLTEQWHTRNFSCVAALARRSGKGTSTILTPFHGPVFSKPVRRTFPSAAGSLEWCVERDRPRWR